MPITPLHLGLLPALKRASPYKISSGGFVLTNLLADVPVVLNLVSLEKVKYGAPMLTHTLHDTVTHTFVGALVLGCVLGLLWFKRPGWLLGCILGALTHVALDMLVHADVAPFAPLTTWNPFYFEGSHAIVSTLLAIGLSIWILEYLGQTKAYRLLVQWLQAVFQRGQT